jgi:hypothetical protein
LAYQRFKIFGETTPLGPNIMTDNDTAHSTAASSVSASNSAGHAISTASTNFDSGIPPVDQVTDLTTVTTSNTHGGNIISDAQQMIPTESTSSIESVPTRTILLSPTRSEPDEISITDQPVAAAFPSTPPRQTIPLASENNTRTTLRKSSLVHSINTRDHQQHQRNITFDEASIVSTSSNTPVTSPRKTAPLRKVSLQASVLSTNGNNINSIPNADTDVASSSTNIINHQHPSTPTSPSGNSTYKLPPAGTPNNKSAQSRLGNLKESFRASISSKGSLSRRQSEMSTSGASVGGIVGSFGGDLGGSNADEELAIGDEVKDGGEDVNGQQQQQKKQQANVRRRRTLTRGATGISILSNTEVKEFMEPHHPYETIDFEENDGPSLRDWFKGQTEESRVIQEIFHYLLAALITVLITYVFIALFIGTEKLGELRIETYAHMVEDSNLLYAALFAIFTSLAAALIPATLIVLFAPSAVGSGMTDIITFLNGNQSFNNQTATLMISRILGTFGIVVAGLFSGIDGPVARIGAGLAVWIIRSIRKSALLSRLFCKYMPY